MKGTVSPDQMVGRTMVELLGRYSKMNSQVVKLRELLVPGPEQPVSPRQRAKQRQNRLSRGRTWRRVVSPIERERPSQLKTPGSEGDALNDWLIQHPSANPDRVGIAYSQGAIPGAVGRSPSNISSRCADKSKRLWSATSRRGPFDQVADVGL